MVRSRGSGARRETATMPSSQSHSADEIAESTGLNGGAVESTLRPRFVEAARRAAMIGLVNAATTEAELARRFTDELCEVFDAELACMLDGGEERMAARAIAAVGLDTARLPQLLQHPECARAVETRR